MMLNIVRFCSLLFTALALAPAMAHLLELPNKIGLAKSDYLVVQQIYRGWNLLGIVVVLALVSDAALTIMLHHVGESLVLPLVATLAIVGTQIIFWTFTFPANQQTNNWTTLPESWERLRTQWEYSHAASAVLNLLALIMLTLELLHRRR
jgi:hypothetical protein